VDQELMKRKHAIGDRLQIVADNGDKWQVIVTDIRDDRMIVRVDDPSTGEDDGTYITLARQQ
jgi:hypothetical protein